MDNDSDQQGNKVLEQYPPDNFESPANDIHVPDENIHSDRPIRTRKQPAYLKDYHLYQS